MKPIKPLGNRVLVEMEDQETQTEGGIFIPQQAAEKPTTGKVLATGEEVTQVVPGQRVLLSKYGGSALEGNLKMVAEYDILAIFID